MQGNASYGVQTKLQPLGGTATCRHHDVTGVGVSETTTIFTR